MRNILSALVLLLCATVVSASESGSLVRVPVIGGLYTVEAPSDWHLEESGDDLTATFAEEPDADGALVIAAPNPAAPNITDYNRLAANALLATFGNGIIVQEEEGETDGFPSHTLWIEFEVDGAPYLGWSRTIDFDGIAVQAMTLATAGKFVPYMDTAGPILDSYELDPDMVEENIELLSEVGKKVIANFEAVAAPRR